MVEVLDVSKDVRFHQFLDEEKKFESPGLTKFFFFKNRARSPLGKMQNQTKAEKPIPSFVIKIQ